MTILFAALIIVNIMIVEIFRKKKSTSSNKILPYTFEHLIWPYHKDSQLSEREKQVVDVA